jgi:hypothetical protein
MSVEDVLIAAGAKKILKKRFFCACDEEVVAIGIQEQSFVDCNGHPTQPHFWVPPGRTYRFYNEDDKEVIERKIRDKEAPFLVSTEKSEVKK